MSYLILVRHGQSTWNKQGIWTGWTDVPLSEKGIEEAKKAGESLKNYPFNKAYTSDLLRAKQTLDQILNTLNIKKIEVIENKALKERDYGIYTGKNKWDIQKQVGEEEFKKIRRSFTHPIPQGETLQDVYNRVIPYFQNQILPDLKNDENILISAHGNSLRALVKYLENLTDEQIADLEIKTGETIVYSFGHSGQITDKQVLFTNPNPD